MASIKQQSPYKIRFATPADFDDVVRVAQTAVKKFAHIPELSHLPDAVAISSAKYQEWLDTGKIYLATTTTTTTSTRIDTDPITTTITTATDDMGSDTTPTEVMEIINEETVVGFIALTSLDGNAFISVVSVDLQRQGSGIGGHLLESVLADVAAATRNTRKDAKRDGTSGRDEKSCKVSLMTYTEIPWHAPWYRKFGFEIVDPSIIGPEHEQRMKHDVQVRDMNRPGYTRCCMLWEKKI